MLRAESKTKVSGAGQAEAALGAQSIKQGLLSREAEPDCRGRGGTQRERQGQSQFPEPRCEGRSRRIEGIAGKGGWAWEEKPAPRDPKTGAGLWNRAWGKEEG